MNYLKKKLVCASLRFEKFADIHTRHGWAKYLRQTISRLFFFFLQREVH